MLKFYHLHMMICLMQEFFYEKQSVGLGKYFFDVMFTEIDSLKTYAGIHPIICGLSSSFK